MPISVRRLFTTDFQNPSVPFFETVIRYLGGLLSAYALSRENILLEKADELANFLDPVFNTGSGLPAYAVDFQTSAIPAHALHPFVTHRIHESLNP
jgi:hypothetical protein